MSLMDDSDGVFAAQREAIRRTSPPSMEIRMLVRPIARWVNRSRVERLSILLTCLVLVVSERAGA